MIELYPVLLTCRHKIGKWGFMLPFWYLEKYITDPIEFTRTKYLGILYRESNDKF